MTEYPCPHESLLRDYKRLDENATAKTLHQVDWNFSFFNKNIHGQVIILNRTLINVFSSVIPNEVVIYL